MHQSKELQRKIQAYLPLHGARVSFIARFVMALILVRGVTLSTVASAMNPKVLPESNEKRIKRFFSKVELEGQSLARFILALLPNKGKLVLTLDRTTWELGSSCTNILMLGVAHKGLAFPLLWVLLDKRGNSDTKERLALVDRMLTLIAVERVEAIVADREFTGKVWFKSLSRSIATPMRPVRNASKSSKTRETPVSKAYLLQVLSQTKVPGDYPMHKVLPE